MHFCCCCSFLTSPSKLCGHMLIGPARRNWPLPHFAAPSAASSSSSWPASLAVGKEKPETDDHRLRHHKGTQIFLQRQYRRRTLLRPCSRTGRSAVASAAKGILAQELPGENLPAFHQVFALLAGDSTKWEDMEQVGLTCGFTCFVKGFNRYRHILNVSRRAPYLAAL